MRNDKQITPEKEACILARGKKWASKKDAEGNLIDAVKKDPEKMNEVEFYLKSLDPKTDINWSAKSKADLKKACDKAAIKYSDDSTKDDLIVLLENTSDEAKEE